MPRGQAAKVGDTMTNALGYHNTRTETGWRLTHHLIAEKSLGRKLNSDEMVRFKDGDKTNLTPSNIEVIKKNKTSLRKKLAIIEAKLEDLQAERAEILKALELEAKEKAS